MAEPDVETTTYPSERKRRFTDRNVLSQGWEILQQYKLAGVVIVALGWFAFKVYTNMQEQQNQVFQTQQTTIADQNKFILQIVEKNAMRDERMMVVVENNTKAVESFEKRLAVIEALVRNTNGGAEFFKPERRNQ